MQLTRYTDYGFRLLTYLALQPKERKVSIDEISDFYDVSRNHINKIVHQLGKSQIIMTVRGRGGGFYLHKAPEDINLGEVFRLLENQLEPVQCMTPVCKIVPACKLNGILQDAAQAFMSHLDNFTLADLIEDNASLSQLIPTKSLD